MNIYDAIRIKALRDVVKGNSPDYALRKVFRWYSKTFATPLTQVEDLPVEFVLQAYWESMYEDMEDPKLEAERVELTKTEAERKAEDRAWDEQQAEEVAFTQMVAQTKKIEDLKPEGIKALVPTPEEKPPTPVEQATHGVEKLNEVLNNIKELPPDVRMTFVTDEDMSALLEEDSIPVPVKPK